MSLKPKAKDTWTKQNGLEVSGQLKKVGEGMKDNEDFINLTAPYTALEITDQGEAMLSAYNNRKADKDNYDKVLADSCTMLKNMSDFVTKNCKDDVAIIHGAGFESTATVRTPATLPEQAVIKSLNSKNGNIAVSIEAMAGVDKFTIIAFIGDAAAVSLINNNQINIAAGASPISFIANATTHETLGNLPVGADVHIIVFAHNAAGTGPASHIGSVYVQK